MLNLRQVHVLVTQHSPVILTWQLQEMNSSIGDHGAIGSFEPTGSNDPL